MIVLNMKPASISQKLVELAALGYQLSFRRNPTFIYCLETQVRNPDCDRIIYAITLTDGRKGYIIDASSVYTGNTSIEMEQKFQHCIAGLLHT